MKHETGESLQFEGNKAAFSQFGVLQSPRVYYTLKRGKMGME